MCCHLNEVDGIGLCTMSTLCAVHTANQIAVLQNKNFKEMQEAMYLSSKPIRAAKDLHAQRPFIPSTT